jgi:hypothetical protein
MCLIKFGHSKEIIKAVKPVDNLIKHICVSLLLRLVKLLPQCIN